MKLRQVRAGEAYQLAYFASFDSPDFAAEVENWVASTAWSWFRDPVKREDRQLRCFTGNDGIAGVVAHHRFGPGLRYLMVVVLDSESRGRGLGRELCKAAIEDASQDGDAVFWIVHRDNAAGLVVSETIGTRSEPSAEPDAYVRFVFRP